MLTCSIRRRQQHGVGHDEQLQEPDLLRRAAFRAARCIGQNLCE